MKSLAMVSLVAGIASNAFGQIVVDGVLDADYGNPKAVQVNATGFGNGTDGVTGYTNGSELDGAWIKVDVDGGNLFIFLSGNLETNFNKLEVFIDCVAGAGQNALRSDNPDVDFNGLNAMGEDTANAFPGLRFDEGFAPDFFVTTTIGGYDATTGLGLTQYANIAQILTDGGGVGAYIGSGPFTDAIAGSNLIDDTVYGCQLSINNSNVDGVSGDSANPGSGCGVTTGMEIKIPLANLGWSEGPVRVCAFINGQGHDYASNQVLGTLPAGTGNLGGNGTGGWNGENPTGKLRFSFVDIEGVQFFSSDDADACVSTPVCPGDLDDSGSVDAGDIGSLLILFGDCAGGTPGCAGDLDDSGAVDAGDIGSLLILFGECSA
jgi:hypothetical protein